MAAWHQSHRVWRTAPCASPLGHRTRGFAYGYSLPAYRPLRTRDLASCVPPSLVTVYTGTGISTGCPSATPRGLALGPTNPRRTNLASEPWGLRCGGFSPPLRYSYRHSHFRWLQQWFPPRLHCLPERSPTTWLNATSIASVPGLSPGGLSAPRHS